MVAKDRRDRRRRLACTGDCYRDPRRVDIDRKDQPMQRRKALKKMLDYLFPRLDQANDVKAWATERLRRKRRQRKARAA